MYSSYGKWIVQKISEIPSDFEITAIIRHSERPDFKDIPPERWNSTLLTSHGEEIAVDFGKALVGEAGAPSVAAKGWGLERCQLTAERIAQGASQAGGDDSSFSSIVDLPSPISNLDLYRKYLGEGKYFDMVRDWFSGSAMNALKPYERYSKDIISKIARDHMPVGRRVTIIVTHDLYVLPMLNHIFGGQTTDIDFMDGIILAKSGGRMLFFDRNAQKELPLSELE